VGLLLKYQMLKSRPNFSQLPKTVPPPPNKYVYPRQIWIFFWLWIQFERNFYHRWIWQSVHAFRNLPSFQSGLWAAHTVLCTWKSIRLSDWSNQPSLTLAGPTRWWELAGQTQVTHIYAGGHDSYSSVQVRLRVIRPDNQICTLWVTMIRQAREAIFEIARFSNRKKKTSACSFG
jgi:hypothetical protein